MTIYYASSTRGFYMSDIHGTNIPEDKVEISSEYHLELIEGQSDGKVITSVQGHPVLADPIPPNEAEQIILDNNVIIRQIQELETNLQPRAMRDFLLYEDSSALIDLDNQIVALRAQLK